MKNRDYWFDKIQDLKKTKTKDLEDAKEWADAEIIQWEEFASWINEELKLRKS